MLQGHSDEPKRPASHQIGDNAQDQVRELFTSQGWVVNSIDSDYGDDLHIQLTEGSILIPVRAYIQVKGTNNIEKFENGGKYKIPNLKKTTVSHWINSEEPTVLVLWDIKKRSGVYGFTEEIFDGLDFDKKIKHLSAMLPSKNTLDKKSIKSFKVDAISFSCDKKYVTLLGMQALIKKNKDEAEFYGINEKTVYNEMANVLLLYLSSLGVLEKDKNGLFGVNNEFHIYLRSKLREELEGIDWESNNLDKAIEKKFVQSIILSLIGWRQNKFKHDSQGGLIDGATKVIESYYQDHKKQLHELLANISVGK